MPFWRYRIKRVPVAETVGFFHKRVAGRPTAEEMAAVVARLLELRRAHGVDLAVFDPVSEFLPAGPGGSPIAVRDAMPSLGPLTQAGMAVLLLDRPGAESAAAHAGLEDLPSFAHIHLQLRRLERARPGCGRRELIACSGYAETPGSLRFAMNGQWTDAHLLPERAPPSPVPKHWPTLKQLLEQTPAKLTRTEIHHPWPAAEPRPHAVTLWRWLEAACARHQLVRAGSGNSADPYRYGLVDHGELAR